MTKGFTSKDIVSIIAACHKNRVKTFKWGDLSLDFDLSKEEPMEGIIHQTPTPYEPEASDIKDTLKAEDPLIGLEKHLLLMEDPLEFERQMMTELKGDTDAFSEQIEQNVHGRGSLP